jgi:hypothetical protein
MKINFYKPVALALMLGVCNVFAGTTGKITGIVIDYDTREPLPGAVVKLLGTNIGANTDITGKYIISYAPVGTYSLQARMMGYQSLTITDVNIVMDFTTTVNFKLKSTYIEMEGTEVKGVRGGKPYRGDEGFPRCKVEAPKEKSVKKIKYDQTQTIYTIPAEEIEHTPAK